MAEISDKIRQKLSQLPELPGIYKMLDVNGTIIYVGKSKCLKKRVKSYFVKTPKWEKVKKLVRLIDDIEYIVTDTHLEARLLECELIKKIRPTFNSQMKNDKRYVFLKVEDYKINKAPLSLVNERTDHTYGPFRSYFYLNNAIAPLRNLFPLQKNSYGGYTFDYNLIPSPMDKNTFEENRKILLELLSDDDNIEMLIHEIENRMIEAASDYKYETASIYRDMIPGLVYIKNGINRYKNLISKDILLKLTIPGGYKLFFVSQGTIILKKNYKVMRKNSITAFIEKGSALTGKVSISNLDEKTSVDFRDILFSEITSLPEDVVIQLT